MQNNLKWLIGLPFFCFTIGYLLANYCIGNKTYKTPNLVGLRLHEALKLLTPYQVHLHILSEKKCANIPANTILTQNPAPERAVKAHQSVFVTITKAPEDTKAPQLLTKTEAEIKQHCHDLHIKYKMYHVPYQAPSGTCFAQLPQAHEILTDKKMILYCAAPKQDSYLMPDFTKHTLHEVLAALAAYTTDIAVFYTTQKITAPYPEQAIIIAQKPLAGSLISLEKMPSMQLEITNCT